MFDAGFFSYPSPIQQEREQCGQKCQSRDHAHGDPDGHDEAEAGDSLMFGEHEAAESGHGIEAGDEDRFSGAFGKNPRALFLDETVEDIDPVGDADADDEREGHDIGGVEGNAEAAHEADHPDEADGDGKESEDDVEEAAEMDEDESSTGEGLSQG